MGELILLGMYRKYRKKNVEIENIKKKNVEKKRPNAKKIEKKSPI